MARALSPSEYVEMEDLAGRCGRAIRVLSGYRNTVTVEILGPDGHVTEWQFIDDQDPPWKRLKFKRSAEPLHFQPSDVWRYASLRAREFLAAVQKHCKDAQVARRGDKPSKRTLKALASAKQKELPLELHDARAPITGARRKAKMTRGHS